jgi:hypothetical protein
VILLVLAAGLSIFLAVRASSPPKETLLDDGISAAELERIRDSQKRIFEDPLPGEEPPVPPELDIRIEVDPTGEKNRILYYITESHGYYVDAFEIDFWYKPTPEATRQASPLVRTQILDDYLKANETFKGCFDVVDAELAVIGGEMGTTENWGAEVYHHAQGRARMQNPDRFPEVPNVTKCD